MDSVHELWTTGPEVHEGPASIASGGAHRSSNYGHSGAPGRWPRGRGGEMEHEEPDGLLTGGWAAARQPKVLSGAALRTWIRGEEGGSS
jgi:hypothetical protein